MKNLFVIIFIVSSINCSFLRELTGTGFTVSNVTLSEECIIVGSDVNATLTFTVDKVGDAAPGSSLTVTFTSENADSTKIETTCDTSGQDNINFTCQLSGKNFQSLGSYELTSVSDGGANTFTLGGQTPSLKVAQTYELGDKQTASQTINEKNQSFKIVFEEEELKDKSVPQIYANESSIQGCSVDSKDANTVECTPTSSEMPVGKYTIHYLNGCNKASTGVTVEVSSSGTGTGAGTGTGNGTSTGNGTETNSESKSAFITLSTLTLFVFGILF